MISTRQHKLFILWLLALYVPLVLSLDHWHEHDATASDEHHSSCAACHFAASHAPVVENQLLHLELAANTESFEQVQSVIRVVTAANTRAPPMSIPFSLCLKNANSTIRERDGSDETIQSFGRVALCGNVLCIYTERHGNG